MAYRKKRGVPKERSLAAAIIGTLGGRKTSAAKAMAAAKNGGMPRHDGQPRGNRKGVKFPNRKRPTKKPSSTSN